METNTAAVALPASHVYPTAQEIVTNHTRLAMRVARRLHNYTVTTGLMDMDDLVQVALMAMIKAGDTYKPELGSWTTHAYRAALGKCLRAARKAPVVHTPVNSGTIAEGAYVATLSLDAPRSTGDDGESDTLHNTLADESFAEQSESAGVLSYLLERVRITDRERVILQNRWLCEPEDKKTLAAVGTILGMTAARVQQIEVALFARFKKCATR